MTTVDLEQEVQVKERIWFNWVNDLAPWERHWVFMHHELHWHDSFVHADVPLEKFAGLVRDQFPTDEQEFSQKV